MEERPLSKWEHEEAERLYRDRHESFMASSGEARRLRKENLDLKIKISNLLDSSKTKGQRKNARKK